MRGTTGLICLMLTMPAAAMAQADWRVSPDAPVNLTAALPEGMADGNEAVAMYRGTGFTDRFQVHRRDEAFPGAPLQPWTRAVENRDEDYDLSYRREWTGAHGRTTSGLEVSLTPHAGLDLGPDGTSAEAGATLRIGQGLDGLAPEGSDAFGERPRWYLYAAGSRRALGYNFARTRDGEFTRSGVSQDRGSYLGDASIGIAYRRGPVHTSFGLAYREVEAKGLRSYQGLTTDVAEGLVAFQLSIRP